MKINKQNQKLVKIFPREYWKQVKEPSSSVSSSTLYTVNDQPFHSSLDEEINVCNMKEFFGTIQKIEINNDIAIHRLKYFTIIDQQKFGRGNNIYEWDLCAIQEELNPNDYPEYYL